MGSNLTLLAEAPEMNLEYVASVVITGLVVVFIGLIILILFVWLMGKLFEGLHNRKKKQKSAPEAVKPAAPAAPSVSAPPVVEDGIGDEVVAVIAAAISAMSEQSGKKLVLKSVRSAKPQRNHWAVAGLQDNTRPFF